VIFTIGGGTPAGRARLYNWCGSLDPRNSPSEGPLSGSPGSSGRWGFPFGQLTPRDMRLFLRRVIFATPNGRNILAQTREFATVGVIVSILGKGIANRRCRGFCIANYALDSA
jgi:hypothetical protein